MELWCIWVLYQWKEEQGHFYLQVPSRLKNVEGVSWRVSAILVRVTCLYPSQWAMIHSTHHCTSSEVVIQLNPLPISPMYAEPLPYQQSNNFIQWTKHPL